MGAVVVTPSNEQPDWLKRITSGLVEASEIRLLIDGNKYAVIQIPGGNWSDNGGTHYGPTEYIFVIKGSDRNCLRDSKIIKVGGRKTKALMNEWKTLVEKLDKGDDKEWESFRNCA